MVVRQRVQLLRHGYTNVTAANHRQLRSRFVGCWLAFDCHSFVIRRISAVLRLNRATCDIATGVMPVRAAAVKRPVDVATLAAAIPPRLNQQST